MSETGQSLPLDGWHRARGARMVDFAGYAMPIQYEGIIAEHLWTRVSASLFDVSHMGQLVVSARDAARDLESVMPGDLRMLQDGRLRYSLLLNQEGGIVDDLIATRMEDRFALVVNGATKHGDIAYLRAALPTAVVDHMKEQALLALQGPKAAEALARFASGVEDLRFMSAAAFSIGGARAWISRSGYTGEDGFEISVLARDVQQVADRLLEQPEVRPAGLGARDSLRLEAGLPLYGHDLDGAVSPVEAGLDFAIPARRRAEGGFPGFDRIRRELEQGPNVRRVGLSIAGRQPVREGAAVIDAQGAAIGKVTSGGYSPTLQAVIAMAYIPLAWAAIGTPITLSQRGRTFDARVVPLPFVSHRYHRKEGSR
ncbi:MAG TPA: glycine cleavage system aminomethyltransferase GcvT [Allosphingosinicella sp.]|nr:glycine cleavage system aminomethyltransferase GcvT [Allosphingosinicella sp.]